MSSKNKPLSKKQRRIYSKLITQKLIEMGIKDEITMQPTGKKIKQLKMKEDGTGLELDENGTPQIIDKEVLSAKNLQRNMVRNLRKSSKDVVEAFLNLSVPKKD